jgi:hypothetical protein
MPLDAVVGGVYVKAHWLFVSIHTFGLKIPPAPLSLHDIIPIIEEDGFEVSATVAVTVSALPAVKVAGFGVTVVVVASSALVDICDVAELLK